MFKDHEISSETHDDLNYSFLSRTFVSNYQKAKRIKYVLLQILNNTNKIFEKVG